MKALTPTTRPNSSPSEGAVLNHFLIRTPPVVPPQRPLGPKAPAHTPLLYLKCTYRVSIVDPKCTYSAAYKLDWTGQPVNPTLRPTRQNLIVNKENLPKIERGSPQARFGAKNAVNWLFLELFPSPQPVNTKTPCQAVLKAGNFLKKINLQKFCFNDASILKRS